MNKETLKKIASVLITLALVLAFFLLKSGDKGQGISNGSSITDPLNPRSDWYIYDAMIEDIDDEVKPEKRLRLITMTENQIMWTYFVQPICYTDNNETIYLEFNPNIDIFTHIRYMQGCNIRNAIAMLLDKPTLCNILGGSAPADSVVLTTMSDGNGGIYESREFINNSLEESKKARSIAAMFRKGGCTIDAKTGQLSHKTPVEFTFLIPDDATQLAVAEEIKKELGTMGVNIVIDKKSQAEYDNAIASGEYELILKTLKAETDDPTDILRIWTTENWNVVSPTK